MKPWDAQSLQMLRDLYGTMPVRDLAARMGRTESSIKTKAKILKVHNAGRFWSEDQVEIIRQQYRKTPTAELAARFGRSIQSVHRLAHKLRLVVPRFVFTPEHDQVICDRHAQGWSDREIAELLGCDRHALSSRRAGLGLPRLYGRSGDPGHPRYRDRVRRRTALQLQEKGLRSLADLRSEAYRQFARENGWPDDTPPRAVQILNLLAVHGPLTRQQMVDRLGIDAHGRVKLNRAMSSSRDRSTYLAWLQKRGLICYLHQAESGQGRGHRCPGLYLLTALALEMIERRIRAQAAEAI